MKKLMRTLALLLVAITLFALCGCSKKPQRTVHCDRCGKAISVDEDSNVTEDWILFCNECAKEVEPVID